MLAISGLGLDFLNSLFDLCGYQAEVSHCGNDPRETKDRCSFIKVQY